MKSFLVRGALALLSVLMFVLTMIGAALAALLVGVTLDGRASQAGYAKVMDCSPFENVVATGKASVRLDNLLGTTIDRLVLGLAGGSLTKAMLTNIRLLANEIPIFEDTGPRTDTRNVYRGITTDAAYLSLDFAEIRAHSNLDKYSGSLDTVASGIRKLSLEVDITGATTPALSAQAMVRRSPRTDNLIYNALIAKVVNKTWSFAAAGEFPLALSFAAKANAFIKRVHLFGSTVTAARVRKTFPPVNGISVTDEIFKATDAQNDRVQVEFGRTPQANQFTIDFMPDGDVRGALPLADAVGMEWYATVSGAGNVIVVTELLAPLAYS